MEVQSQAMPSDMGNLPQVGPAEEAIEAIEAVPPPAQLALNQVSNSPAAQAG